MPVFSQPGSADAVMSFESRYEHYIGGEWVAPVKGEYFENVAPQTGQVFCEVGRGTSEDIEAALDAAWAAAPAWGASFHTAMRIGKFHGMIWPTTPSGSWKW